MNPSTATFSELLKSMGHVYGWTITDEGQLTHPCLFCNKLVTQNASLEARVYVEIMQRLLQFARFGYAQTLLHLVEAIDAGRVEFKDLGDYITEQHLREAVQLLNRPIKKPTL